MSEFLKDIDMGMSHHDPQVLINIAIILIIFILGDLIFYFRYLGDLKNVGLSTSDLNLQVNYKVQFLGLFHTISMIILLILQIFMELGHNISYPFRMLLYSPGLMVFGLFGIIFQFLEVSAFHFWADNFAKQNSMNPFFINLSKSTTWMIWGLILEPIGVLSLLGDLIIGTIVCIFGAMLYFNGLFQRCKSLNKILNQRITGEITLAH